jgi:Tfp pilus assembly protein PilW
MTKARLSERGLSMVEVLVAFAVLVVAVTIALLIYEASRKSFKKGENVSEQQQTVRIAFDRLTSDLRMAGFNYNPDGDANRPDEQIEAAFDTAIVLRADLDAEIPADAVDPEDTLDGDAFLTVSTGNDEIVAYVLAKDDGSSTGTLTFSADVQEAQRDGDVEAINIANVALVQDDPPYTLYRVTVNDGATTVTKTPLVENVQSMNFRYYSQVGNQINSTFDLTSVADDIGGAESASAVTTRGTIRRIGIEIVGLTRDPDLDWVDTTDTNPDTRRFRKFPLNGDVTPRNLGMVGIQDLAADITPPAKPGAPTLIPGHCQGLFATWPANAPEDQVTTYRMNLGLAAGSYTVTRATPGTSMFISGLTHATQYFGMVQAVDSAGNMSIPSNETSATTSDVNTPQAPTNPSATTNLNGAIQVSWDAVTANTAALPAQDPNLRDLAGYRVYRSPTANFTPTLGPGPPPGGAYANESKVGAKTNPDFTDQDVVNCKNYYYQVTAVDLCGKESTLSPEVSGRSTSNVEPKIPGNVQAFFQGLGNVRVEWDAVTEDVNDNTIYIEKYNIYRSPTPVPTNVIPVDAAGFTLVDTVTGATQYTASHIVPLGYMYWYAVTAVDDCPNESQRSAPVKPECAFSGDIDFVSPQDGSPVAGVVPVTVQAVNSTDTFVEVKLEFYHETNAQIMHTEVITTSCDASVGPCVWNYDWLASPPGPYTITATVKNSQGCAKSTSINVASGFDVGCCLSAPDPTLTPITLTCTGRSPSQCKEISYELINNNCLTAVAVEGMRIGWVDNVGNKPQLTGVRFDNSLIWNVTPPSNSPATNSFSAPKPSVDISRNSTNPVDVTYVFDQVMSAKVKGNNLTDALFTEFSFRLLDNNLQETAITGTCSSNGGSFANMVVEQHN